MSPLPDSPSNLPSGWQDWPTERLLTLRLEAIGAEHYDTADAVNAVVEARVAAERDSLAGYGIDEHGQLHQMETADETPEDRAMLERELVEPLLMELSALEIRRLSSPRTAALVQMAANVLRGMSDEVLAAERRQKATGFILVCIEQARRAEAG